MGCPGGMAAALRQFFGDQWPEARRDRVAVPIEGGGKVVTPQSARHPIYASIAGEGLLLPRLARNRLPAQPGHEAVRSALRHLGHRQDEAGAARRASTWRPTSAEAAGRRPARARAGRG